ncbi:SDR family oxidoreductase [Allosalinactinospora lopnorensis]|uniref:SDR family oxidoreductase n=1 Tax=Allosalinactinospora lopnorensis TaxID=1352348 RepID=UPI000623FA72|nr:SDR family oxidoreductase [Allosalinactinospora lopnorensis]
MSDLRFDGRVAIVTGAGHGLGRSYALELTARGAKVVVNDVRDTGEDARTAAAPPMAADDVTAEIRNRGGTALADRGDISTEAGAEALVEAALDAFGRVDIVVNNAGILRDKSFKNISVSEWDAVLDVHLRGTFLVSRAAFGHLREHGYGRIVNTTSRSGLFGNFGQSNYAAAEMGVVGLTKTLAIEGTRYDITANAVAPIAYTRMTSDLLPPGTEEKLAPERVTPAVVWLAHEDCETSGEIYTVGGGRVARVFVAEGPGAVFRDAAPEDIRDSWPDINAERPYVIPRSLAEHAQEHFSRLF